MVTKAQQEKQIQVFGYGLPVLMLFLAWRHTTRHQWDGLSVTLLVIAGGMLLITLFYRPALVWIFHQWMKVAQVMGIIVTTVILSGVYFLVFTPVSVVLRLMGKDYMRRFKKNEASYWINAQEVVLGQVTMKNQY